MARCSFKKFSDRFVTGIMTMAVTDWLSKSNIDGKISINEKHNLPNKPHHFATIRTKIYSPN